MTTTTGCERLLPFGHIRLRATGRDGGSPHISTWIRWATRGARLRDGTRIRLRAVRTPGGWRSCEAWVDEFLEALTRDRLGIDADANNAAAVPTAPSPHPPSPRRRTARERQAAAERAGKLLESMGC